MISRLATKHDIQGIIDLQEQYLFANLSETEKKNGFVTTPFTISQLSEILKQRGLFVTENKGIIVGYTMAACWAYFSQWPIFPHMISRLSGLMFKGTSVSDQNTFQYGPVCVDSHMRGTDLFPHLFETMRMELSSRFPVGITFINKVNKRSYKAHTQKLGMTVVDEFEFSGQAYYGLAFDTALSVLM